MFDEIDVKILNRLQESGRIKRNALAEEVGLSLPSLSERMRKLEDQGIIEGYYAKVNRKSLKMDLMAIITVIMDSSKSYKSFSDHIKKESSILECYSVLGEGSHILKAVAANTADLELMLSKIQSWPGVMRTVTSFVLSTIKETTKIDIKKG